MWIYKSRIGPMRIYRKDDGYALEIASNVYGFYASPEAAADDVASFVTGCYDWDKLDCRISNYPVDLSCWTQT